MKLPLAQLLQARKTSGKGVVQQLLEIYRLNRGEGGIGPSEYFDYELYDDSRHPGDAKERFVGWREENTVNQAFNKEDWAALSLDKILFYSCLKGAGIAHPRVLAVYSENGRFIDGATTLKGAQALTDYLRNDPPYPLFIKPSHGNFGTGAHLLKSYDQASDSIVFADNSNKPVMEFVNGLDTFRSGGQVIQEVFKPHPTLAERCGPRASTVRMVLAMTADGPSLMSAVWKIPTGNNVIDNFHHGSTGNLVSSVDTTSGTVTRIVGMNSNEEYMEVEDHPDTGERLIGSTLPQWQEAQELCARACTPLPGLRLLHFDVALTDQGPQILEVNKAGNIDLHQFASGRGFLTDRFRSAMADQVAFQEQMEQSKRVVFKGEKGA